MFIFFDYRGSLPLLLPQASNEGNNGEMDHHTDGSLDNGTRGKEEGDEEDTFFDAVEVSTDEWVQSKSVSFKPTDVQDLEEEEGSEGKEGEEGEKMGHKRNMSGVSVNEAQMLVSSPEPDQLPSCSERTMLVSLLSPPHCTKLPPPPPPPL